MSTEKGLIFDIKRFAVHDGPGIRTTIFLKGCPLSCWWCHNPEGLSQNKEIIYYDYRCMGCDRCVSVCSQHALEKRKNKILRHYQCCISCGSCVDICPSASQQLVGQHISTDNLINEIEKDTIFFESSSGGVTFSGGEPLMQPVFLHKILNECINRGIHTAVDTSGYASSEVFNSIMDFTDLFLFDLKIINEQLHAKYTGVSNRNILKNLKTVAAKGKSVILRFILIKDVTTSEENVNNILDFVSSLSGVKEIDLLSFHSVAEKYVRFGKHYKMDDSYVPSKDEIINIKELFEQRGFHVKIGG